TTLFGYTTLVFCKTWIFGLWCITIGPAVLKPTPQTKRPWWVLSPPARAGPTTNPSTRSCRHVHCPPNTHACLPGAALASTPLPREPLGLSPFPCGVALGPGDPGRGSFFPCRGRRAVCR